MMQERICVKCREKMIFTYDDHGKKICKRCFESDPCLVTEAERESRELGFEDRKCGY